MLPIHSNRETCFSSPPFSTSQRPVGTIDPGEAVRESVCRQHCDRMEPLLATTVAGELLYNVSRPKSCTVKLHFGQRPSKASSARSRLIAESGYSTAH